MNFVVFSQKTMRVNYQMENKFDNITKTPNPSSSEFPFVLHSISSPKNPVAVKPSLHELAFKPNINETQKSLPQ